MRLSGRRPFKMVDTDLTISGVEKAPRCVYSITEPNKQTMPKVKMKRQSTNIDMTAMCDVAFLLLTFFMLAAKTKKPEPVMVATPSSISQITIPDTSIMLITVDNRNRVFFSIDQKTKGPWSRSGQF